MGMLTLQSHRIHCMSDQKCYFVQSKCLLTRNLFAVEKYFTELSSKSNIVEDTVLCTLTLLIFRNRIKI